MGDTEEGMAGDTESVDTGDTGDTGDTDSGEGAGVSDDFPTVEPAPEPDNPRFSTEHEETSGEPQPLPGGES